MRFSVGSQRDKWTVFVSTLMNNLSFNEGKESNERHNVGAVFYTYSIFRVIMLLTIQQLYEIHTTGWRAANTPCHVYLYKMYNSFRVRLLGLIHGRDG